jgi:hypothetical protein
MDGLTDDASVGGATGAPAAADPTAVVAGAEWLPIRVYPGSTGLRVDWMYAAGLEFDAPFFRDTVQSALRRPFAQAFRIDTSIDALVARNERAPGPVPVAFIYHASRCGSTLLARMLMALPTHRVLSEPPPLDVVLRAPWFVADVEPAQQRAWLRALLGVSGACGGGQARLVVKLDAWHVAERALLESAFPGTASIFLYRDPLEIAVSQLAQPGAHMVPGMLGPSAALFPPAEALAMPRSEFVARTLGRIFEAGLDGCRQQTLRPVHYDELPAAAGTSLAAMLGVAADDATRKAMLAVTTADAKNPQLPFTPDREAKRAAASPELVAAVDRHVRPAYAALEALRAVLPRAAC